MTPYNTFPNTPPSYFMLLLYLVISFSQYYMFYISGTTNTKKPLIEEIKNSPTAKKSNKKVIKIIILRCTKILKYNALLHTF